MHWILIPSMWRGWLLGGLCKYIAAMELVQKNKKCWFLYYRSANAGKYSEAIADFETALTINHTHKNAHRYLVETQIAYGEE